MNAVYAQAPAHSIQDTTMPWIAFYIAKAHEDSSEVVEDLQTIMSLAGYLISLEIAPGKHLETNGEHFHFLLQCHVIDYNSYVKRILRHKYNLRGQTKKGLPKQYGRVKQPLEDVERMGAYVCKDARIFTNLAQKDIDRMFDASFKKKDEKDLRHLVMIYIDEQYCRETANVGYHDGNMHENLTKLSEMNIEAYSIKLLIVRFFRQNPEHRMPLRSKISYYLQYYAMYHKPGLFSDEDICVYFFL